jgi:hypothetical protein
MIWLWRLVEGNEAKEVFVILNSEELYSSNDDNSKVAFGV